MTQEYKELLLRDLYARLPYGVIVLKNKDLYRIRGVKDDFVIIKERAVYGEKEFITKIETVKPYLRPMSSMTEEEYKESKSLNEWTHLDDGTEVPCMNYVDWLNAHHFDYRGLIEKGLALEAPKDMYK
jgi:hypothetical protein